jgi:hypothetical protein
MSVLGKKRKARRSMRRRRGREKVRRSMSRRRGGGRRGEA